MILCHVVKTIAHCVVNVVVQPAARGCAKHFGRMLVARVTLLVEGVGQWILRLPGGRPSCQARS